MSLAGEIAIVRAEIKRALGACDALARLAAGVPAAPARVAAMRDLGSARTDLEAADRRLNEAAADLTPVRPHSPAEMRLAHESAQHFRAARAALRSDGK